MTQFAVDALWVAMAQNHDTAQNGSMPIVPVDLKPGPRIDPTDFLIQTPHEKGKLRLQACEPDHGSTTVEEA